LPNQTTTAGENVNYGNINVNVNVIIDSTVIGVIEQSLVEGGSERVTSQTRTPLSLLTRLGVEAFKKVYLGGKGTGVKGNDNHGLGGSRSFCSSC
jgi:hypothetical protein